MQIRLETLTSISEDVCKRRNQVAIARDSWDLLHLLERVTDLHYRSLVSKLEVYQAHQNEIGTCSEVGKGQVFGCILMRHRLLTHSTWKKSVFTAMVW
jgi:ribonuclease HIII